MKSLTICIFFILALVHLAICQPSCDTTVSNLRVEQITPTIAKILWSRVPWVLIYRVDYKLASSIPWNTEKVPKTSLILERLIPNEEYQVRVMYYCNENQESRFSDTLSFRLKPCETPGKPKVDSTGYHYVRFKWKSSKDVLSYEFQHKSILESTWTGIITQDTVVEIDSLKQKSCFCRVRSLCKNGVYSDLSINDNQFRAHECYTPLFEIDSITKTTVTLHWNRQLYVIEYLVEYKKGKDAIWQTAKTQNTYFTLTQLSEGTDYDIRVRTRCPMDTSPDRQISIRTQGSGCFRPINISIDSMNFTTFSFHWNHEPTTTLYLVEYKKEEDTVWNETQTPNSYITLTQLSPGNYYQIRVRSQCKENEISAYSNTKRFKTLFCNTPNLNARMDYTSAYLSWFGESYAKKYLVEYKRKWDTDWKTVETTNTYLELTQLERETTYYFRIRSKCTENIFSHYLSIVEAATLPYQCFTPTHIKVDSINYTTAYLQWDTVPFVALYHAEYKLKQAITWQTVQTQNDSITLNQLKQGAVYQFRLRAKCERNDFSPYSNTIEFRTNCVIPSNVDYVVNSSTSVTVSWNEEPNLEGYVLIFKPVSESSWSEIDTKNSNQIIDNLEPNTDYYCKVRSICGNNFFSNYSQMIHFRTWALGIPDEEDNPHIFLSPNPAHDLVSIRLDLKEIGDAYVDIYSVTGAKISTHCLTMNTITNISTADLADGVYFCKFTTNGQWVGTHKLIIEK